MMHNHLIDFIIADKEVFVSNRSISARIAVEGVNASGPEICAKHVQVLDLLRMARVQFKELFATLRHSLDL